MLLGVYGAEIIKVEPPEGDWSRYLGTTHGSHTALSAVYNRGKRWPGRSHGARAVPQNNLATGIAVL
jgi:hypothetical protein